MKDLLKSKAMIVFIVIILGIVFINTNDENKKVSATDTNQLKSELLHR